jgi:hypothetical protein
MFCVFKHKFTWRVVVVDVGAFGRQHQRHNCACARAISEERASMSGIIVETNRIQRQPHAMKTCTRNEDADAIDGVHVELVERLQLEDAAKVRIDLLGPGTKYELRFRIFDERKSSDVPVKDVEKLRERGVDVVVATRRATRLDLAIDFERHFVATRTFD